jgi:ELWxxDGT repeat protein
LCYSAENEDGLHLWTITRDQSTSNGLENTLVASPNPTGNSNIQELYVHDDRLYFSADDGVHGQELWVSDGTASGTFMLKDISSGANSSFPKNFVSFNGKVYFTTFDGLDEGHIWITDGTAEGTVNTAGIWDIGLTQSTANMNWMEYNGKLYYAGFNRQMSEHYLCVTDGTASGTNWVIPSNGGGKIQLVNSFNKFVVMNNELYFIANPASGETGPELYKLTDAVSIDASIKKEYARLIAYPNPAMDALTIQRTGSLTHADVSVFNVNGQLMINEKITLHSMSLAITDWPSGIYFIRYADQSQISYLKFVKN